MIEFIQDEWHVIVYSLLGIAVFGICYAKAGDMDNDDEDSI